jgi:hypothetical protein
MSAMTFVEQTYDDSPDTSTEDTPGKKLASQLSEKSHIIREHASEVIKSSNPANSAQDSSEDPPRFDGQKIGGARNLLKRYNDAGGRGNNSEKDEDDKGRNNRDTSDYNGRFKTKESKTPASMMACLSERPCQGPWTQAGSKIGSKIGRKSASG